MRSRRSAALGLWAALTYSSAVLIHGAIHAAGSQSFVLESPAHGVMLVSALALLAGVAVPLGFVGPARERRRRLALVRADLGPPRPALAALWCAFQVVLAAGIFAVEGAGLDQERIVVAIACGLGALLLSLFLFRRARERVVAILAAFAAAIDTAKPLPPARRSAPRRVGTPLSYRLFVPNRPPPLAV